MESLRALADQVAQRLLAGGGTVAIAESSTGGLVCASLLEVPGASGYFRGGGVIYTQQAREGLLGIGRDEMADLRSATEPYALLLAGRIRERLGADWGLAETGATGPRGNRYGDPAGHSCFGVVGPGVELAHTLRTGSANRVENMRAFSRQALELMLQALR